VNGTYQGFGVFDWKNGDRYEGEWKFNLMDGLGTLIYKNQDVYKGEFFKGIKQGQGKFTKGKSLLVYDGPWMYGKQHGVGNLVTKDGQRAKALYGDGKLVKWVEKKPKFDEDYDDLSSLL